MSLEFTGPLFVVGMPRSGTKLLRTLLKNHSKIYIPSIETNLLPYMCKLISSLGNLKDKEKFEIFYKKIISRSYFKRRTFIGKKNIELDVWYQKCENFTPEEIFKVLIINDQGLNLNNCNQLIWGDKSPSYINHIPLLKKLYPQARIIHIVRDVRDYCLSIQQAWGKNMYRAAHRWNHDILKFKKDTDNYNNDIIEIKYEDLLDDANRILINICEFLEIKYESGMDTLQIASENLGEAKNLIYIKKDNKDKYKDKLSRKTLEKIESIAHEGMCAYNYPVVGQYINPIHISSFKLFLYKIFDGFHLFLFYTRERGLLKVILNK